ncbi:hypothetical protein BCR15_13585 [Tessaracoccus lapidicaptus]|uniref:Uncharacterized protein n=2 Tax=Tessaracoccus lapidicaptus TaxID=1427523 RepID=A0A1C0AQW1_9ACTN|nr:MULTISPECIES: hypothetical protein [Tessaracoccus]AQX14887.1 hypothetical protein BKM78_02285 [Tessaracoccus sp. T2.5-30]OCL36731.1 hypothetical protein BCR15_13585 [Tessaracoccus lapidicaptus]VEP39026.1 hypothetical protein TLA_TLA_00464 [Tessaracoccus lapidicaptus]
MDPEIAAAVRDGVVTAKLTPRKARALNAYACRGQLERVLPGVYGLPGAASSIHTRLQAVRAYGDDLTLVRRSAAALTFWPEVGDDDELHIACPRKLTPGYGLAVEQRLIPPELLTRREGVLCTVPELTVLDLIPEFGGDVIQEALRRRACTLKQMRRALALTPRRRFNRLRRDLLDQSRDSPWSALELRAHAALREAGITGWISNLPVTACGRRHYVDAGFRKEMVALEIDGYEFHGSRESFHRDRARDIDLMRAGWLVAHFTEKTLPSLVDTTRALLAQRGRPT